MDLYFLLEKQKKNIAYKFMLLQDGLRNHARK